MFFIFIYLYIIFMIVKFYNFLNNINELNQYEIYDNDDNLNFWGNSGAGVIPYCKKTKRFLISYRSGFVNEPYTYGVWGGKIDDDEIPTDAVIRELYEETKFNGNIELIKIYTFIEKSFKYYNYIGIVENEFIPILDFENEDYVWLNFNDLLNINPKHFGLESLLKDDETINIIKKILNNNI